MSDSWQLELMWDKSNLDGTYKSQSVHVRVLYIFQQIATRHPIRNQLGRRNSSTQYVHYIRVPQVLPQHNLLAERLGDPSVSVLTWQWSKKQTLVASP